MLLPAGAAPRTLSKTPLAKPAKYPRIRFSVCPDAESVNVNVARLLLFGAVIYLLIGVRFVKRHEWLVITRSGKYIGFKKSGLHWVLPFLDKTELVDLRQVSEKWEETPDQIIETKVHDLVKRR